MINMDKKDLLCVAVLGIISAGALFTLLITSILVVLL